MLAACSVPDPMEGGRHETMQQLFGRYVPKGMPVISGERRGPAPSDDQWVQGITYGKFTRTFTLPEGIDAAAVKATHRHGALEVDLSLPTPQTETTVPITVENTEPTA